ncbi:MAG: hypothetical protein QE278_07620 [Limnobacter sp.]|nr:hypothetical protein [Limnobacter sp.]
MKTKNLNLYAKLTEAEKKFLLRHPLDAAPIALSREKAFAETKRKFGMNGHNDSSDAFRHCFWSAVLARDIGYACALEFTTLHESKLENPILEKEMDLHNNRVGLDIGKGGGSDSHLSTLCMSALINKRLKVIKQ